MAEEKIRLYEDDTIAWIRPSGRISGSWNPWTYPKGHCEFEKDVIILFKPRFHSTEIDWRFKGGKAYMDISLEDAKKEVDKLERVREEKLKSDKGRGNPMGADSCERAVKAATELLEELGCGIDAFANLMGLQEDMPLSSKCKTILSYGIDKTTCLDFGKLRRWTMCRAWEIHDTQKVRFRDAMSTAWDEAEDMCRGFVPEEHLVP